jgi:hypothetical protein
MFTEQYDWEETWGQLVARAWSDDAFKKRLLADPGAVLKEEGVIVPAGFKFKVLENTDKVVHLVLPVKPAPAELSAEELHSVAGGHCRGCGCGGCGGCRGCGCGGCRGCGCERCGCRRCGD